MSDATDDRGDDSLSAQILWEYELSEEIRASMLANGMHGLPRRLAGINWDYVHSNAEALGIDLDRVTGIIKAAKVDLDWHRAVDAMIIRGLDYEAAVIVTREIAEQIDARRMLDDGEIEDARERKRLAWAIVGGTAFAVVLGFNFFYSLSIWEFLEHVALCMMGPP